MMLQSTDLNIMVKASDLSLRVTGKLNGVSCSAAFLYTEYASSGMKPVRSKMLHRSAPLAASCEISTAAIALEVSQLVVVICVQHCSVL